MLENPHDLASEALLADADAWEEYGEFVAQEESDEYAKLDEWYDYITSADFRAESKQRARRALAVSELCATLELGGIPVICEE